MSGRRGVALLAAAVIAIGAAGTAVAAEARHPDARSWGFNGIFGTFDRAALQRGYQVYKEVCSACHALKYLSFRNLAEIGFSETQAKAIAAEYEVEDGPDEDGEMFTRPAKLFDRFVAPFANDNAARASNNGALPPDLSLVVKARLGGEDYLYALLTGYVEAPAGAEIAEGMSYNPYFSGNQIAMAPPLDDDAVEYADGTETTVAQMSSDVVTFLAWAAEPRLEDRKRLGFKVMIFLIVLTGLLFWVKRRVWRDVH